jgi:hypothetical protein
MIQGLNVQVFSNFLGGRVTNRNLTEMTPEQALIASNVVFLGDKAVAKRPGYTLVRNMNAGNLGTSFGALMKVFDFQRDSDNAQFLLTQLIYNPTLMNESDLVVSDVLGIKPLQLLSSLESPTALFDFTSLDFACYCSNGLKAYRLVDNAGTLTKYNWGIAPPNAAPTLTVGLNAGILNLTYGRQYMAAYVAEITDELGDTRISVGLASAISGFTGPITSGSVTLALNTAGVDAQVTHIWWFATYDTPENTASVFQFLGESPIGSPTFIDTLNDPFLDPTRLAPTLNYPVPPAEIIVQYAGRPILLRVNGEPDIVQACGGSEISLGIPAETAPPYLFFKIPGGKHQLSNAQVFNQTLYISTQEFWWSITGNDASNFSEKDKVVEPGAVGKQAACTSRTHLFWISPDRKLNAWDGVNLPLDLSMLISKQLTGCMSMEDIPASQLQNIVLKRYHFGRFEWIMAFCNTGQAPPGTYDWIQVWDTTFLPKVLAQTLIPTVLEDGTTHIIAESDFWPTDIMTCADLVEQNDENYMFMGDQNGNVYRWPDGYQDNGRGFHGVWGSPWSPLKVFHGGSMFHPMPIQNVEKLVMFADLVTDRQDAATAFQLKGLSLFSPDMQLPLVDIPLNVFTTPNRAEPTAARGNCNVQGVSLGQWHRFAVIFPDDNAPATLYRLSVGARPIKALVP